MRSVSETSSSIPKPSPRFLKFEDIRNATGFINDVSYTGVENVDGSKPVLLFNAIQPRLITLRLGRTLIAHPLPAVLPIEVISEASAINVRDLVMIDGGVHQILRCMLAPMSRLSVQRKDQMVEFTLTISPNFRHTFAMELSEIPDLRIVH